MKATPGQLPLQHTGRGGSRGGGRPRSKTRRYVPHRPRPELARRHPVHVTLRMRREVGSLRRQESFAVVRGACARAKERLGLRIVHFSAQDDHLHLLVEAESAAALSAGMKGLGVRLARRLNALIRRRGPALAERYHAHVLRTPREVRNALVYVLNDFRKHAAQAGYRLHARFDPRSSAPWFDGWAEGPAVRRAARGDPPVAPPRTWLLERGWRLHGKPSLAEVPRAGARRA